MLRTYSLPCPADIRPLRFAVQLLRPRGEVLSRRFARCLKVRRHSARLGSVSTLQEIKSAIANLNAQDKALLAAELFAMDVEPDAVALEAALERGLQDVKAGRMRPAEEVKAMIPRWTTKS